MQKDNSSSATEEIPYNLRTQKFNNPVHKRQQLDSVLSHLNTLSTFMTSYVTPPVLAGFPIYNYVSIAI
jgi:hypothetical protein